MTRRIVGVLEGELREAGQAELCLHNNGDEYGSLDRMMIESSDVYVEYRDVVVGYDKYGNPLVEHRMVKIIARRDEESMKIDDCIGREQDEGDEIDEEDAMNYVAMSIDEMEMNMDEDEPDGMMNPATKWDLLYQDDGYEFNDDDEWVEKVYSAPVFPRVRIGRTLNKYARNLERAIEKGVMKKRELFLALQKLNPLASCEYEAKKAIKAAEHHLRDEVRQHYVRRYKWLRDVNKSKDTIPASQCAYLWALVAQVQFLNTKKGKV